MVREPILLRSVLHDREIEVALTMARIEPPFHTAWALNDRPPFSGRPSLTGHCGHGWTCRRFEPVANDPQETSATGLRIVAPKLFKPVLDCVSSASC